MSEHEDLAPLDEMAEAAGRIDSYLVGVSRDQFLSTPLLKDAVSLNLIVIGEAARKVSLSTRDAHPSVEWRALRHLRNRIAHGYGSIDHERVWAEVQADLPGLRASLANLLEKLGAEP